MLENSTDIVQRICEELSVDMARTVVDTWFSGLKVVSFDNDVLVLDSPSEFKKEMIVSRH